VKRTNNRIKDSTFSLASRIFKILIVGFVIFGSVLLAEMIAVNVQLRNEVIRQNYEILDMQTDHLDEWLLTDENDLAGWNLTDSNVHQLKQCRDKNEAEMIIARIRALFSDNMNRRSFCELYFVKTEISGTAYSGMAVSGDFSAEEKRVQEQFVRDFNMEDPGTAYQWQLVRIGDEWYYFFFLESEGVFLGQAVRIWKIGDYIGMQDDQNKYLGIRAGEEILFFREADNGIAETAETVLNRSDIGNGMIQNNCLVTANTSRRLGSDIFYVQEDVFTENYTRVLIMLYGSVVLISFVYLLIARIAYKNLKSPLNVIKKAMLEVKRGNMETEIADFAALPVEFRDMAQVFNDMMCQIKIFKISSYENEIKKKDYEIQYLSLQIEPHFYLNAMKGLYALAQKKKVAEIQELILALSEYFRYLTYHTEHMVSLQEEIDHVKCYLNILHLESSRPVKTKMEMDSRANDAQVPKLMLQTFIENSFKYASADDRELEIEIRITVSGEEEEYLFLSVSDNGQGFSGEVISQMSRSADGERNDHVGLSNLYHRLKLLYGDRAYMHLSNKEPRGALAEVMIPISKCGDK